MLNVYANNSEQFDSVLSQFSQYVEEGRKPKTETFNSKSFNLSKIENSLEEAKKGFLALANIKWLGNLKPEKVEQVFNAVIEQLGKDDNVSYESVKKSIDFALNKTLPSTNAGKWSRQFRNWIENLQDIQGTIQDRSIDLDDTPSSDDTPSETSAADQVNNNDSTTQNKQTIEKDTLPTEDDTAELDLSDFQQNVYDILTYRKESGKGSMRAIDILSMVNIPFDERDRGEAYLNNELRTLKNKGLIKPVGGGAWEAIEKKIRNRYSTRTR